MVVVDVGSGYMVVEISGECVCDVIVCGCLFDLYLCVFKLG